MQKKMDKTWLDRQIGVKTYGRRDGDGGSGNIADFCLLKLE